MIQSSICTVDKYCALLCFDTDTMSSRRKVWFRILAGVFGREDETTRSRGEDALYKPVSLFLSDVLSKSPRY